jgi:hypothetical protein
MGRFKFILFSLFFIYGGLKSQETTSEKFLGVLISGGNQKMGPVDIYKGPSPYTYSIVSVALQYQNAIVGKRMPGAIRWRFYYMIQPQVGFSTYQHHHGDAVDRHGMEFGIDAGFVLRTPFLEEKMAYYLGATTGPFYASALPERQHAGFLFCDTGFTGITFRLSKNLRLDTRFSFRHLSNAGIVFPNQGVNNFISNAGVIVQL